MYCSDLWCTKVARIYVWGHFCTISSLNDPSRSIKLSKYGTNYGTKLLTSIYFTKLLCKNVGILRIYSRFNNAYKNINHVRNHAYINYNILSIWVLLIFVDPLNFVLKKVSQNVYAPIQHAYKMHVNASILKYLNKEQRSQLFKVWHHFWPLL